MSRTIFLIAGPSGSGKTSLTNALLEIHPTLTRGITVTTRAPRSGETEGKDYYFVTPDQFDEMATNGSLLESDSAYGESYGVPRSLLAQPGNLALIVTLPGAVALKSRLPDAKTVLVLPESYGHAEQRIRERRAPKADERVSSLQSEFKLARAYDNDWGFDAVIHNVDFPLALRELQNVYFHRGSTVDSHNHPIPAPRMTYLSSWFV
jgi:guanylate kinase